MRRHVCLMAFSLSLFATGASGEDIERHFEHSFDARPGMVLHLVHGDGDVAIEPWDESVIDVQVHYRQSIKGWHFGGDAKSFEVRFRQMDDHVYVEEQREGGSVLIVGASLQHEYTYTIRAPRWVQLDLEGEDGDVEISRWGADIDLSSDDGDVTLLDCDDADYDIRLQDGDLSVNRCSGRFDVELSDGDVDFRRVTTKTLQILVEDGDVDLDLIASGAVDWEIELVDGDLSLEFPSGLDADVELETDEGRIRVGGFEENGRRREQRLSARLGEGGGRILARSEDGDLSLRQIRGAD